MDKGEIYRALEKDFTTTFIEELIPGILHNFANPLNGIMGRSKLLQRRIEENIRKMEEKYPDAAAGMADELQRIRTDIRAVNHESEYFFEMFKDVAGKFYALAAKNEDRINISQLLAAEMRFVNFYLDFKHEIKKDIQWDKDIPDFKGNTADLSLAFWRIIRFAMTRALASPLKEFYIKTDHDSKYVSVFIKSSGDAMPATDLEALMENLNSDSLNMPGAVDQGVLLALLLFDKYQAKINVFSEENFSTISISFPYRNERISRKEI
jgi:nitrogen-specific signal transduction histidine kinase